MGKNKFQNIVFTLFFSLLFLSPSVIIGQSSIIDYFYPKDNFTAHHNFKHWSTANGLPQNSVRSIAQTKDGYLWLATQGGLVRFDGMNFTVFEADKYPELGGDRIISLAADSVGGLWILGENSHVAYLKNNKFTNYTPLIKDKLKTQDNTNREIIFNFILRNDSSLILLTLQKIIAFDFKSAKILFRNKSRKVYDIFVSNDKSITLITKDTTYILKNNKFIPTGKTDRKNITTRTEDKFGNIITVETIDNKRSRFKTKVVFPNKSFYLKAPIGNIFCDNKNRIWLAGSKNGLWLIDNNLKLQKINYTLFQQMKIRFIYNDKDGNLWMGTNIKGLFKIERKILYPISLKNGTFNDITYPILKDRNGAIWIGSVCGGIARIKNGKVSYFSSNDNTSSNCIYALYETKKGKILAAAQNNGVMEFNGNRFIKKRYSNSLEQLTIFTIFEQSNKNLWFGTSGGLFLYKNGKFKTFSVINSALPGQRISAIAEDKEGVVWFATNKGLANFKNGKLKSFHFSEKSSPNYVRSIYIDKDNTMWLGTYGGGLIYFKNGIFKIINKADGLFDNYIHATVEDKNGFFWMPTNHGLFITKKSQLINFVKGKINKVDYSLVSENAHLPSNEFNGGIQPQYCMADSETILFPSFGGTVAVDLSSVSFPGKPPKTFIEYFSIDNKIIKSAEEYIVPKDYSEIKIKFTSIAYNNPERIFFKYKLEPLDKTWRNINNERMVVFNHLPPGKYKFKVTAYNLEGNYNNKISSLNFIIRANFYQTSWFKILVVLLLLFSISFFYWLKLLFAKKREQKLNEVIEQRTNSLSVALEKANLAKQNEANHREKAERLNNEKSEMLRIVSHDLKNPLGAIKSATELIESDLDDTETVKEMADIIRISSNRMLNSVDELLHVSKLEDENFMLNKTEFDFVSLVKETINQNIQVAASKGQSIETHFDDTEIFVYADYEKITSCVDNYLSNAIKYSPINSKIEVFIETDEQNLIFKVKDYGAGLTEEDLKHVFEKFRKLSARPTAGESSSGLGLSIVKKIIELHGGKVGVESQPQKGSLFFFILPIRENNKK